MRGRGDGAEACRAAPAGSLLYALKLRRDGIGIPIAPTVAASRLADTGHGPAAAGLGHGLIRAVMALHGGTLILASAVGKGTTATLIFPASRVLAP